MEKDVGDVTPGLVPGELITVTVKVTGAGQTLKLNVRADSDVEQMKNCMQQQHGFPPEKFRFVWKGRQLELHETLLECSIAEDSLLHIVIDTSGNKSHEQTRKPTSAAVLVDSNSNEEPLIPPAASSVANSDSNPDRKCCIIM